MKRIAILLLCFICVGFLFSCGGGNDGGGEEEAVTDALLSYEDDMSKYVTLAESDRPFSAKVSVKKPGEFELNEAIVKLLYNNRNGVQNEGLNQKDVTVKAGDVANIFYRGYTVENGDNVYFDGGCNFTSTEASLGIGSGGFIPGFEAGLVGKNSKDYVSLATLTEGEVLAGDIAVFSYTSVSGGKESNSQAYIFLSDGNDSFGAELRDALIGAEIGASVDGEFAVGEGENTVIRKNVKVTKILRPSSVDEEGKELPTLTVDAFFPENYGEASLAGKWAKFDVYIMTVQVYDAPSLDDAFVTDVLKIDGETLNGYDGECPAEKYKNMMFAELMADYEAEVVESAAQEMWKKYVEKAEVKTLPQDAVDASYNSLYSSLQNYYNSSYYSAYVSFEDFAAMVLQLGKDETVSSVLLEMARESVVKEALLYYLLTEENLMPSEEELTAEAEKDKAELLAEYLKQSDILPEKYDTEQKYNEAKAAAEKSFNSAYTLDYFKRAYLLSLEGELVQLYGDISFAE